ncbi:MAG: SpoIIE family protein phosphatase [Bacteroidota bacterium]
MAGTLFEDIRSALQEKQANLTEWLESTPEEQKQVQLGPAAEVAVEAQLETIETALEEIQEGTFGVCEICNEIVDGNLLQMDYTSCICLDHYSPAQRRQLEDELEFSQTLQRALLPQQTPVIPGLEIAAFSRPAQIVTGDYFDFVQFRDGSHGLVIADVSGHGVSAGMLMTSLQTAFHTLSPESDSPVQVLERLNRLYIHNIHLSTFVTVFFAKLDPAGGSLCYANAGHPVYLYRAATDEDLWLRRTGPAIGLVEDYPKTLDEVTLQKGDVLVLYTDGITEAMNSADLEFGSGALAQVIRDNKDASAEKLVTSLIGALGSYIGDSKIADDITLVVCKVR